MSLSNEHLPAEELGLTFKVGEVTMLMSGIEVTFNTDNAAFWTLRQTPMLNHIVFTIDGRYKRRFIDPGRQAEVFGELARAGITHIKADSPSDELLAQFWEMEMEDFDLEMETFNETGEIPDYGNE